MSRRFGAPYHEPRVVEVSAAELISSRLEQSASGLLCAPKGNQLRPNAELAAKTRPGDQAAALCGDGPALKRAGSLSGGHRHQSLDILERGLDQPRIDESR